MHTGTRLGLLLWPVSAALAACQPAGSSPLPPSPTRSADSVSIPQTAPELFVSFVDPVPTAISGDSIEFVIHVTNRGSELAEGVVVDLVWTGIDARMSVLGASRMAVAHSAPNGIQVEWAPIERIAPGESVVDTVLIAVGSSGELRAGAWESVSTAAPNDTATAVFFLSALVPMADTLNRGDKLPPVNSDSTDAVVTDSTTAAPDTVPACDGRDTDGDGVEDCHDRCTVPPTPSAVRDYVLQDGCHYSPRPLITVPRSAWTGKPDTIRAVLGPGQQLDTDARLSGLTTPGDSLVIGRAVTVTHFVTASLRGETGAWNITPLRPERQAMEPGRETAWLWEVRPNPCDSFRRSCERRLSVLFEPQFCEDGVCVPRTELAQTESIQVSVEALVWMAGIGRSLWWAVALGFVGLISLGVWLIAGKRRAPVRILFMGSVSANDEPLQLDEEIRAIDRALQLGAFRGNFELVQHWAVRFEDIARLFMRHEPHVVHFSGHGNRSNELILKADNGGTHAASPEALGRLFTAIPARVRCVVLNACYSGEQVDAILQHVDSVIGMSDQISDSAAIRFSEAFYEAVSFGKDLRTAFDLGCARLGGSRDGSVRARWPADRAPAPDADMPTLLVGDVDPAGIVLARSAAASPQPRRFQTKGTKQEAN